LRCARGQVKRKIQPMSTKEVKRELARRSESTDLESDPSVTFYSSEFENVIQDRYGLREA
jgi:hypothetical protein